MFKCERTKAFPYVARKPANDRAFQDEEGPAGYLRTVSIDGSVRLEPFEFEIVKTFDDAASGISIPEIVTEGPRISEHTVCLGNG